METRYFKKDKGYISWYMSLEKSGAGLDVMVDDSGSMASARKSTCQVVPNEYEPCTEEEFSNAFERAIGVITKNMLIAA